MNVLTRSAPRALAAVAVGVGVLFATGCAASDDSAEGEAGVDGAGGTVQVFAAASLNNAGAELAEAFADSVDSVDSVDIEFNVAGSSALVRQIDQGADADLFISADEQNMDAALELEAFDGAEPHTIATNELVLAVAADSPFDIAAVEDLNTIADGSIALCADGVPCGTLANQVLDDLDVTLDNWVVSEEANVSDVATKIATGEVDAGFIYSTDAIALQENAGADEQIDVIELSGTDGTDGTGIEPNAYPAALTVNGRNNATAGDFLEWLSSDSARGILEAYGFGTA